MNPHNEAHNSPERSEADIVNMLGTYADALERHTSPGMAPAGPQTPKQGAAVMHNDENLVDLEVRPVAENKPGRSRMLVGAAAAVAALVIGGVVVANQGGNSELDVAEVAADEDTEQSEEEVEQDEAVIDEAAEDDSAISGLADDAATTVPAPDFFSGPNSVVVTDEGFARLGGGDGPISVSRSANGTDWTTEPTSGLPEGGFPTQVVQTDSGWVTVLEVWPELDESDESFFFGPGESPDRFIATSSDLQAWTSTQLDDVDVPEGGFTFIGGVAASGDTVAVLLQVEPGGVDERRILFDAGAISEADLGNYCGGGFEGDDFVAYSCDFDFDDFGPDVAEEATEDDGSSPTTTLVIPEDNGDFPEEREELVRLVPGDEGYDEIFDIFNGFNDVTEVQSLVLTGPADGPLEVVELPTVGFTSGIAGTDDGFAVLASDFNTGAAVSLSSPDGVDWSEPATVASGVNVNQVAVSNGRLLVTGTSFNVDSQLVMAFVSDDLGLTWTESTFETELFGSYGMGVGGPAGFAVWIEGTLEPFQDDFNPFGDVESFDVVVDGYTTTFQIVSGGATLTGPDGVVIHDSISEDAFLAGGIENVVRFGGQFDEDTIWLDPVTGEDLVTVTAADIEAVVNPLLDSGPDFATDFVEPDRASELWFSPDGVTWTLLDKVEISPQDSFTALAAVGDDEVLVVTESFEPFQEPPSELLQFEQEGREPTDEELAALDEFFAESDFEQAGGTTWRSIPVG